MQAEVQTLSQRGDDGLDTPPFTELSFTLMSKQRTKKVLVDLPITPPDTEANSDASSNTDTETILYTLPPPSKECQVLDEDKKTPDSHVPRDARLIRLTGVHPFNVEPPLSDLFNDGFLTTPELFYVRNHGAVPSVRDEDIPNWELSIEGMVENPFTIKLQDLIETFEVVTYPVTLVCAGNRRKEQNLVRQSKGFSWGSAGVSTALFTGVAMSDLIKAAKPKRGARYVCMEGADKLPNGYYGTHAKLNWVMDPNRGIMVAHMMNGEMLRPDHGKPLRVVIPGQIGGRSVKWLKKLIVTEAPSDNWYHIYDNRVLPTTVSPEESANDPKWWQDERYAIYDLSTNAAIAYPAHEEQLCTVGAADFYRCRGYAYGGGGRRVTRVELSLNGGRSWRLANIQYPEDAYREADGDTQLCGGRLDMSWRESSFTWCFWHLDMPVAELSEASDMVMRAMDESMNVMPKDMYWSVLGMMNNPWYRITITRQDDNLRFEHPTQPARMPGGWMERVKKAGGDLMNGRWGEKLDGEQQTTLPQSEEPPPIKMTRDGESREIGIAELREHDTEKEPWFVLQGEVFDGTAFLKEHPGGAQSILSAAGLDVSDEFMAIHSETAKKMMSDYHIGTLSEEARGVLSDDTGEVGESDAANDVFLTPRSWSKGTLHAKKTVSWDTKILTFALDHEQQSLGLPIGQHLMMRVRDRATQEALVRSYTPISHQTKNGFVDVLVKVYYESKEKKGGKMSQALDALPLGQSVDFKGPVGKFEYRGRGEFLVNGRARRVSELIMICGGSGITPIYQVYRAIMEDREDRTKVVLLNGNRLIEDILCREELDRLAKGNDDRCKIVYTLTQAPDEWKGLRGRISGSLLQEHAPCKEDSMVLMCGPEALEKACHTALQNQGWPAGDLFSF